MTVKSKEYKMNRKTADRLKNELEQRIQKWNADPSHPYAIERAVIFGSYVNEPEKDKISDLDIATSIIPRYDSDMQREKEYAEYESLCADFPSYRQYEPYLACYRATVVALKAGSHYIQMTNLSTDKEAVFSKDTLELNVGEIKKVRR